MSNASTRSVPSEITAAGLEIMRKFWGSDDPRLREISATLYVPDASEIELRVLSEMQPIMGNGEDFAGAAESLLDVDVSAEATRIQAPTLLIHRRDDRYIPFEHGLALAALISDVRFLELGGSNHVFLPSDHADSEKMLDAIEVFLSAEDEGPKS